MSLPFDPVTPEHATRGSIYRIAEQKNLGNNERACDGFPTIGARFGPAAALALIEGRSPLWPSCNRCKAAILEALAERAKGLIDGRIKQAEAD